MLRFFSTFLLLGLILPLASAGNFDAHRLPLERKVLKRATATCAPTYTPTAEVTTIKGTGTLPQPTAFVKKASNGQLTLNGKQYRPVGPNIYWLGLQDYVNGSVAYPSKQRIREAMAITVAMGANTIRAISLGTSTGGAKNLMPSKNTWNEAAWDSIDYSVYAAKKYGLRITLPFTDAYRYYTGGLYDFVGFAGLNKTASDALEQFYTNDQVITLYEKYIAGWLAHRNKYTGIYNYAEPTFLAFETGNELGEYMLRMGPPPAAWTSRIAEFIKMHAPHALVIDGSDGLFDANGIFVATGLNVSEVDIVSNHYYPPGNYLLQKDTPKAAAAAKAYLIGEYDWTDLHNSSTPIPQILPLVEKSTASGDMLWSVFGHDDNCCNYFPHNDGYSLYYPNGNTATLEKNVLSIVQHWYRMTGRAAPAALPAVKCEQPAF